MAENASAPLVLAVAQPFCRALDVAWNAGAHARVVREAAGARVVVFPELSLTGYELAAEVVGVGDARLGPLVAACAETGATALVGAPVAGEGGAAHIGVLAVNGEGAAVVYRKMWLGGAEAERFAPGHTPGVYEVDGWRLGLAVCKDTGVPQHAADTAALGIDAYVAGIVHAADEARVHAGRARRVAAAHGTPVAIASFAGPTGGGYAETAGRSAVFDATGAVLAEAGPEPNAFATARLTAGPAPRLRPRPRPR
ncbi:carbon-nitrogen hydrolase family protein [Streptomyces sp. PT12]|uniref:carbon-nitrogen hydrolase family protein n=1 Tax=Streptomyces sp. PT12 TaxID=1510197 RepID=UPI000DE4B208|nr:carbon-nitrogen hydrolase family protein [Streptomyces sp. PT12]RBM11694.1 carbon-nitrogen hydrolase family protein [Streptomyces sp. PT12]